MTATRVFALAVATLTFPLVGVGVAGPPGAEGDLYISDTLSGVAQFDGPTGALVTEDFVTSGTGGLDRGRGLTFGPNGNLFICSKLTDSVIEFDGTTGAPIGTFASGGGLDWPQGLVFGPNGNLFVSSYTTDNVLEYDGTTGALIGTFASGGGLEEPEGLTFGPNGNLFVVSNSSPRRVIEYDGSTGAFIGAFASVSRPTDLVFGPNGNLFVTSGVSGAHSVKEFDGATGAPLGTFASQGLDNPIGLAFGPDGSLFVATDGPGGSGGDRIMQYYGDSGALVRAFVPEVSGGERYEYLTFKQLTGPYPAPSLAGFTPVQADNCAPLVGATVSGTGLVWGAQLRLTRAGEADILGAITGLTPDTAIEISFDLGGAATGLWDLVITYPDLETDTLIDALEITACPGPEVTGIDPPFVTDCIPGVLGGVTITGSGFVAGSTVMLAKSGQPDIPGTNVDVPWSTLLVVDFDLTSGASGLWDVVVTNPDTSNGTLAGGFGISSCIPPTIDSISPTRIIHPGSGPLVAGIWVFGTELPSTIPTVTPTLTLRRADWPDLTDPVGINAGSSDQFAHFFHFNGGVLSGAPLGFYDVILTRPDGFSDTLVDGLEIVADPGLKIKQIGAWGGTVQAVEVDPVTNLAYVGSGTRLLIFDVSDPANPVELGSVMFEGVVMGLAVRDGYAYVGAARPASFCVVDVADPAAPVVVASGVGGGATGNFQTVVLDGLRPIAYAAGGGGPWKFDISDPADPVYLSGSGFGQPPLISGSLMYTLQAQSGRVFVFDTSTLDLGDPATDVTLLGEVQIPEFEGVSGFGCALAGDYLYVTAFDLSPSSVWYSLLFVVDFSDLTAPVHVGTWGDPTGDELVLAGTAVAISDGRLYWAASGRVDPFSRSMVILDIATDPTTPILIGEYASDASFAEIEVVGTTVYLGDRREGFTIVDCSDPANPVRVGNYYSPATMQQGTLDETKLYVTDSSYGLSILDGSNPRAPGLVGKFETGTYTANRQRMGNWGIAVRDDLAYVAAGHGGLQVVDVTDPAAPTLAGEFSPWPDGARSHGLTLSPDEPIVHVGTTPGAFIVNFDVSDLANIVDVASVHIGGLAAKPRTIHRGPDGIAYVARGNVTVTLDLTDPLAPALLGETGPPALDLALDGDVLFTVNKSSILQLSGLDTLSVATPDHLPAPLAHFSAGDSGKISGYAVAAHNGRAYLGSTGEAHQLRVLDVTDPTSPVVLATARSASAKINDLIVDGPYVYALTRAAGTGAGSAGVLIYLVHSSACSPADVTTQGAGSGDPMFGVPDGIITGSDINYYVNLWVAQDLAADLTTQGAAAGDPNFGVPDGIVTGSDIGYYVNLWIAGCP